MRPCNKELNNDKQIHVNLEELKFSCALYFQACYFDKSKLKNTKLSQYFSPSIQECKKLFCPILDYILYN